MTDEIKTRTSDQEVRVVLDGPDDFKTLALERGPFRIALANVLPPTGEGPLCHHWLLAPFSDPFAIWLDGLTAVPAPEAAVALGQDFLVWLQDLTELQALVRPTHRSET